MDNQWRDYLSRQNQQTRGGPQGGQYQQGGSNLIRLDSRRPKTQLETTPNWKHIVGFVFLVGASIYIWRVT